MRCFVVARGTDCTEWAHLRKMRGMDFLVFFLFSSPFSSLVVQPGKVYSTNPGLSKALCPAVREGEQPKKKKTNLAINHCPFFD
jgi:hypothetical protein